ncbi:MAG: RagB/SusD family nutrient uptake outer membrane protein, partial [Bacteroidales bacterium]|nr:RagB/SusD family nutrient uptake outer membrane protein [Bacteroidales bacterium]
AYCIFMMSRFFGDIPIIDKATTTDLDLPLRKEAEVQEYVLKEMKEAVATLAEEEEHCMRIFKGSGLALYGKILFMLGKYNEASEQFDAAFAELKRHSPNVKLIDYLQLVDENKDMKYPTTITQDTESLYSFQGMPRLFEAVYGGMYGQLFFGVKNELIEKYFYDKADTRLAFYASVSTSKSAYNKYVKNQQYCANLASNNISTNYAIGLSELYTMQAEALARKGDLEGAKTLLTELRKNRMEPGHEMIPEDVVTADQMVVFAFEERMREQLGFGSSWFDMKRLWNDPLFQDMKQYYVHSVGKEVYTLTEERLKMKLPPTVIAWHPEYNN